MLPAAKSLEFCCHDGSSFLPCPGLFGLFGLFFSLSLLYRFLMHKLLEKYEENVKGVLHGTCSIHFLVSSHQPLEINFCKLILNRINRRERRSAAPTGTRLIQPLPLFKTSFAGLLWPLTVDRALLLPPPTSNSHKSAPGSLPSAADSPLPLLPLPGYGWAPLSLPLPWPGPGWSWG